MEDTISRASRVMFGLAVLFLVPVVLAQVSQTCLNELGPCLNYLNGTRDPPDICCNALKDVVRLDPECICGLISNQGAIQAQLLGINMTEAQELPGRCGQRINPLGCITTGSPSSRNSNQDSSSFIVRRPSMIEVITTAALSMTIRVLWQ